MQWLLLQWIPSKKILILKLKGPFKMWFCIRPNIRITGYYFTLGYCFILMTIIKISSTLSNRIQNWQCIKRRGCENEIATFILESIYLRKHPAFSCNSLKHAYIQRKRNFTTYQLFTDLSCNCSHHVLGSDVSLVN